MTVEVSTLIDMRTANVYARASFVLGAVAGVVLTVLWQKAALWKH